MVNVMNNFISRQSPIKISRHNKSMFSNPFFSSITLFFYCHIACFVIAFSSSIARMVFSNCKFFHTLERTKYMFPIMPTSSSKRLITIGTNSPMRTNYKLVLCATFSRAERMLKFILSFRDASFKFLFAIVTYLYNYFMGWSVTLAKIMSIIRMPWFRYNRFSTTAFTFHILVLYTKCWLCKQNY